MGFSTEMRIPVAPRTPITLYVRVAGPCGEREFLSVLDTGATYTLLPTEDAIELGYDLSTAPRVQVMTANGLIQAARVVLREVCIGDIRARNVEALCYDMPGAQVSALLGLSFLEHVRLKLDLKGRTLDMERA
jgi:clan AA aspartic protease (TIGR02281 family)